MPWKSRPDLALWRVASPAAESQESGTTKKRHPETSKYILSCLLEEVWFQPFSASVIVLCLSALNVVSAFISMVSKAGKWLCLHEELISCAQQQGAAEAGALPSEGQEVESPWLLSSDRTATFGISPEFSRVREFSQ